jgi:Ca2+-binding RTX toxin-like protein
MTAVQVLGTSGADRLTGTRHGDVIRGLAGADVLDGGQGADELYAGPGNDRIDGRDSRKSRAVPTTRAPRCLHVVAQSSRCMPLPRGADVIVAGTGDDIIMTRDGRPDAILCGPGHDIVIADLADLFSTSNPGSACETIRL